MLNNYTRSPYLDQIDQSITRQVNDNLTRNMLPQIGGGAMVAGGFGGSRQGVLEANAFKDANRELSSALAGNAYQDYGNQMNRNLQRYGMDQANALGMRGQDQSYNLGIRGQDIQSRGQDQANALGMRGQDIQRYGMDQSYNLGMSGQGVQRYGIDRTFDLGQADQNLRRHGMDQTNALNTRIADDNFYASQRGQDFQQAQLGASLYDMGQRGQWLPYEKASEIYRNYTGLNNSQTNSAQQGGGWQGALGGALGAAQFGKNMGWWGSEPTNTVSNWDYGGGSMFDGVDISNWSMG